MMISTRASTEIRQILNMLGRPDADFTQKYDFADLTGRRLRAAKMLSANHRALISRSSCIDSQDCAWRQL
jgi:hypothetical protein